MLIAVLVRSAPMLYWPQATFHADEATMGLTARHIAEGRAFPVFQYGAPYELVIETYLSAPLMLLFNGSEAALRGVPLLFNVATALLLYAILTSAAVALTPALALLVAAPVVVPGVNATVDLVSALGMNIEPLFFALVLWVLRERPIALGVVAAVAIKNREFAVYAVAALLFVDVMRDRSLTFWRPRAATAVAFALTWSAIAALYQYSSPYGPGTSPSMAGVGGDNVAVAAAAMCIEPSRMPGDLRRTVGELLPLQWGVRSAEWQAANMSGGRPPDAWWLWWPLLVMLGAGAARGGLRAWRTGPTGVTWIGMYLLLIGLQSVLVYSATRCGNTSFFTTRYLLLSIFIGSGAMALAVDRDRTPFRIAFIGVCMLWVAVCILGHVAWVQGFVHDPPAGRYRELARYLDRHHITRIRTDYWTGYHVAFLTEERVKAETEFRRVHDYVLAVRSAPADVVEVHRSRVDACGTAQEVAGFYLCWK